MRPVIAGILERDVTKNTLELSTALWKNKAGRVAALPQSHQI
jgi:hypothetical protein